MTTSGLYIPRKYFEGNGFPPLSPFMLRVLGGACCAVAFNVYSPLDFDSLRKSFSPNDIPIFLWVIFIVLCILPAIYRTLLELGEKKFPERASYKSVPRAHSVSEAIAFFRKKNKYISIWKGVGYAIIFLILCVYRFLYWALLYVFWGAVVFLIIHPASIAVLLRRLI
jgi:hypothetical protein